MRNVLVGALVLSLSGSPTRAQSLHDRSAPIAQTLRESTLVEGAKFAAALAAQAEEPYRPGGMSPAYFWTSVGLMIGGAGFLGTGALVSNSDSDVCDEIEAESDVNCEDIGTGMMVVGAGLVGTGLLIWVLGKNKAKAAGNPQIFTTPGGVGFRGPYRILEWSVYAEEGPDRGARRPDDKARRPSIPGVFEGGATPSAGMPRPRGGPASAWTGH